MTRTLAALLMGFAILALAGCGGGSSPQTASITTSILSDPGLDGDIEQTAPNSFIITQGMSATVQSVFAGVDPIGLTEYRSFLNFPLGGTAGIPFNAVIDSASLEIHINSIQSNTGTIPILIDLVSIQSPTLALGNADFGSTPLAYTTIRPPISSADVGTNISVDVTSLMVEAQYRGLSYFQVRILEDFNTSPGLIEINDTMATNRPSLAPLLTVTYH